jgi:hypothetical protein
MLQVIKVPLNRCRILRHKKYLGMTVTNQNLIQEDVRGLNSNNACYHLAQTLLSSCLLSKNIEIRICKNIILPVVLYGCETWPLTLTEEHRLRIFENRVLIRIFLPKGMKWWVGGENWFVICTLCSIIKMIKSRRMIWVENVARIGEKRNACRLLAGKPEGKRTLGRTRHKWMDNIRINV